MKALQAYPLAIFLATTVAVCSAAPLLHPAPVYGPPPGAYQRYQQARAAPAPAPFRSQENTYNPGLTPPPPPPQGQQGVQAYQQQRAVPAAPQRQLGYQRDAPPPAQQSYPQSYFRQQPLQQQQQQQQFQQPQHHFQQPQPQQLQRLQPQQQQPPQQPQQQFRTELQGVWRYTVPVRPPPLREDQVPFQGLGATDSVTMPEQAPYDPLLVTGPAAEHFVRSLTDREPHFYPAFPHTRLVLGNQQKRLDNGLPANRLGSIRTSSDFYRGE